MVGFYLLLLFVCLFVGISQIMAQRHEAIEIKESKTNYYELIQRHLNVQV